MSSWIICEADKTTRKITFHVRYGFGDEPQEREEAAKIFNDALDVICGNKYSALPIERWARPLYVRGDPA